MSSVPMTALPLAPTAAEKAIDKTRHGGIDVLRMTAVAGVAFYHAGLLARLPALAGMHALIVAAVFFAAGSRGRGTPAQLVGRRASRLLIPWLFFGLIHLSIAVRNGNAVPWMFVIGGSMHLWFVPFIFIVTATVALACRPRPWPTGWGRAIVWGTAALLLIHAEARLTPRWVDVIPVWQFGDGLTAALVALAVLSVPAGGASRIAVAAFIAAASLPLWLPFRTPEMMTVPPAAVGTLLFLLVAALPAGANRLTDFLGRASFGVYLMHAAVLTIVCKLAARLGRVAIDDLDAATVAGCTGLTIVLCLAAVAVLERTPARRVVM